MESERLPPGSGGPGTGKSRTGAGRGHVSGSGTQKAGAAASSKPGVAVRDGASVSRSSGNASVAGALTEAQLEELLGHVVSRGSVAVRNWFKDRQCGIDARFQVRAMVTGVCREMRRGARLHCGTASVRRSTKHASQSHVLTPLCPGCCFCRTETQRLWRP